MEWIRIDFVDTKCSVCGKPTKSTMKHPVCDKCEVKDDRCMAVDFRMKRCKKRKLPGEYYCKEHLPR